MDPFLAYLSNPKHNLITYSPSQHTELIQQLTTKTKEYEIMKKECVDTYIREYTIPILHYNHKRLNEDTSVNRPVNRPHDHNYKYTKNTLYNNIHNVMDAVDTFSRDFSGDLYFLRCQLLNFHFDVDTLGKIRY